MDVSDRRKADRTDDEGEAPVCPICGGAGYITLDVPVAHHLFGKAVPCRCKRDALQERRLADLRAASNLAHLQHMTFASFRVAGATTAELSESLQTALQAAHDFSQEPAGWLVLRGPYGCGKTHLAAAIANDCVERGIPVLFVVVPDLLDHLRATYAPESPVTYDERFDQVRNVRVLILDDLGAQNATPWAMEKLYQIINYRYNAALPTVITTNLHLADLDPRLGSRLRDASVVNTVTIYAGDFRSKDVGESFGSLTHYSGMNFATFADRKGELDAAQSAQLRQVLAVVRQYAEDPSGWLVVRGGYGVGKTHLAAAVANHVTARGMQALFVVVADLLDDLRATYQRDSVVSYDRRLNEIRRAWLLVLDDLGVENATPWAQEKLFQILNHRYAGCLSTVITCSFQEWERLDERLKRRVQDPLVSKVVDLDVPCYRRAAAPAAAPRRTSRKRL
ncbi:MAG: ATP-binding protein [Chloroflexota bacterium]